MPLPICSLFLVIGIKVYTDEEVERSFEDFYEDVHTEFLKFGEIVNFKVCKNCSSHLRGNVYVHYKSLESAVLAYQSINGRYFAGKQISCEFINIWRWKVAICGEYMRSRLKTCSRGSACNFIHCFRNPGGDYEWADWDKPAPRYWVRKMAALFGCASDRLANEISPSYSSRRSRSRGPDSAHGKSCSDGDDDLRREHYRRQRDGRREEEMEEKRSSRRYHRNKRRKSDTVDMSDGSGDEERSVAREKRSSRKRERDSESRTEDSKIRKREADSDRYESVKEGGRNGYGESSSRSSTRKKRAEDHDRHWREKDDFDPREDSDPDRHQAKFHRSKHTPQRKDDTEPSDIDSHGDRLDRDKHMHHSHSKRRSREVKYEADFSDSASDGDTGRDGARYQKNGRRNSRSKNDSDVMNIERSMEKPLKDERHHGHGRRSSGHHNRDSCNIPSYEGCEAEKVDKRYDVEHRPLNNEINTERSASQMEEAGGKHSSCLDSESERAQACRLAALKKLEEMRKSKDSQITHDNGHFESAGAPSHDRVGVKAEEVSKDRKELLDSTNKVETRAASTKRRRI